MPVVIFFCHLRYLLKPAVMSKPRESIHAAPGAARSVKVVRPFGRPFSHAVLSFVAPGVAGIKKSRGWVLNIVWKMSKSRG